MSKKKYELTEEHKIQLEELKQKWIDNAFSIKAMDNDDKEQMRVAMRGLYAAAKLEYPGDDKIIFVSSPMVGQFASGYAVSLLNPDQAAGQVEQAARQAAEQADQAAWQAEKAAGQAVDQAAWQADQAARQAADQAARQAADQADQAGQAAWQAARQAVDQAARQAVDQAAWQAADQAARQAADQAARQADQAARQADQAARQAAWQAARQAADQAADQAARQAADQAAWQVEQAGQNKKRTLNFSFSAFIDMAIKIDSSRKGLYALYSSAYAWRYRDRGNLYPWRAVFGGFFKHIAKMDKTHNIDFTYFDSWEKATKHGAYRYMHPKFTIISDRPELLKLDKQGRLHCEDGCATQWRDGLGIYYWHGVNVPEWIILRPEEITIEDIFKETNAEVRRVMCERYGFRKFGQDLIESGKAKLISEQQVWGEPVKYYHYNDGDVTMGFIHVINGTTEKDGTKREFILTVKADNKDAEEAVYSTYPKLMERIKNMPNRMQILKKSIRS